MQNSTINHICNTIAEISSSRVDGFDGFSNLMHRVKCFQTVLEHTEGVSNVGEQSLGSRAAVVTATNNPEQIKNVICFSYPLIDPKGNIRDQILLDLPAHTHVLFILESVTIFVIYPHCKK